MTLNTKPDVPHKGWKYDKIIDLFYDEGREYGNYENCEWCGHEQIRYVHILYHTDYKCRIKVGCVCAEHLSSDYINPKKREKYLRNRAIRRSRFVENRWLISKKGNFFRSYHGYNVVIFLSSDNEYKIKIDNKYGKLKYRTVLDAKNKVFDVIERKMRTKKL